MSTVIDDTGAYIKALLRPHFLDEKDLWDAQLDTNMRNDLAVDKVLLQPYMPPHRLHHAQAHRVVMFADSDGGELIFYRAVIGLEPGDQGLVSLKLCYHALAVWGGFERPVHAALDHPVAGHVYDAHGVGFITQGGD